MDNHNTILKQIQEHQAVIEIISSPGFVEQINAACQLVEDTFKQGNKVLIFGNGGSAADAQHIAAEFSGRFVKERRAYPAVALTTDTSALTAIGNDYGFERVFSRQVEALAVSGDLLIGISTSGNSANVLKALLQGQETGCRSIGFTGNSGGKMKEICDVTLTVDSPVTARIQEAHILIGHIICAHIDSIS